MATQVLLPLIASLMFLVGILARVRPNTQLVERLTADCSYGERWAFCSVAGLSDAELEPFRDEIMVWHVNRRELQALTVS